MIAIKVTQTKKRNFPNKAIGIIVPFREVPKTWYHNEQLYSDFNVREALHEAAGFLPLNTNPSHDSKTQKINSSTILEVLEGDVVVSYVYEVVDMTSQEIESKALALDSSLKESIIEEKVRTDAEAILVSEAEDTPVTDAELLVERLPLFKWWKAGEPVVDDSNPEIKPTIRKDFDNNNEIRLWECIQSHTTQSDYKPKDTEALWSRIPFPGEYEVWSPRNSENVYMEGKIVWFPTENSTLYISKIDNNSWSPTDYPQGWEIYIPS